MRLAVETLVWTLVLLGVWVATLTAVNGVEILVALVVAVPVALLGVTGRRLLDAPLRPRWSWSLWLVRLPMAVLADTGRLAVALVGALRHERPLGTVRSLPLPDEPHDVAHARAALAAVALSTTPGAYVVDVGDHEFEVHALTAEPTALERAVTR